MKYENLFWNNFSGLLSFENRIPVKIDRLDFKDIDREKIRDFLKPDRGCEEGITKWFWQNNHF